MPYWASSEVFLSTLAEHKASSAVLPLASSQAKAEIVTVRLQDCIRISSDRVNYLFIGYEIKRNLRIMLISSYDRIIY